MYTPKKSSLFARQSAGGSAIHTQVSLIEAEKKVTSDTNSTNLEKTAYFYALGCSLRDRGDFSQAIESFTSAIMCYQAEGVQEAEGGQENVVVQAMHQLVTLNLHQNQNNLPYLESVLLQALELQRVHTEDSNSEGAASDYHSFHTLTTSNLTPALAETYYQFGLLRQAEKKYEHAIIDVCNALKIYQTLQITDEKVASAHHLLGMIYQLQNQYDAAIASFIQALNSMDLTNDTEEEAETYVQLGLTYQDQGNQEEAIRSLENALSVYRVLTSDEHDPDVARVLSLLGLVYFDQFKLDTARAYCMQALEEFGKETNSLYVAETNYCLGMIHHSQGDSSQALATFDKALDLFRELDQDNANALKIAGIIHTMGQLYQLEQNNEYALAYFQNALDAYALIDSNQLGNNVADIHRRMGEIYLVINDLALAKTSLSNALAIYKEMHPQNHETITTTAALLKKISQESRRNIVSSKSTVTNPELTHEMTSLQTEMDQNSSNTKQLIGTNSPITYYGSMQRDPNDSDSNNSDSSLAQQEDNNENKGGILRCLCNCCGFFAGSSTKRQGSPLSEKLTTEADEKSLLGHG